MTQKATVTAPTATPSKAVPLHFGGKQRLLRFDAAALVAVEDQTGDLPAQVALRLTGASVKAAAVLLWAGLRWQDPDLTLEQVIEMIDLSELPKIGEAIDKAFTLAIRGNGKKHGNGKADPKA